MKKLINQTPSRATAIVLGILPFAFLLLLYVLASELRLAANPNDKLLPSFHSMGQAM